MSFSFELSVTPPFRLDYTVWALRRRAINIVDQWNGQDYKRLFIVENQPVKAAVKQSINGDKVLVSTDHRLNKSVRDELSRLLETMLGLNKNLQGFYQVTKNDKYISPLVSQFRGLKPPRFPAIFEALVNCISCQQISLDAGLQIQNRLIKYIDRSVPDADNFLYAFPMPEDIAGCSAEELKKVGYSKQKSETLIRLASAITANKNLFSGFESKSNDEIVEFLCQFKGIGRWSAEYVLLRGFGRIEAFPGDDVGAQKNLQQVLHLKKQLDYKHVSEITKKWYPYAGLIYFHLLLNKLKAKNLLNSEKEK